MREPTNTSRLQDSKQITSPSPSPYPVSIRAYKKKDYDYLSTFGRMAPSHPVLKAPARSNAELLQERSDCESDLSMTTSSVAYTASISSISSSSSAQSYAKELIASMDSEGHYQHQHYHHQHQHHFLSTQTGAHSPRMSVDCADSSAETKDDKLGNGSSADVKDDKLDIAGDFPDPIEKASAQVKAQVRSKSKPKPRPHNTPAGLPKFGSWDTRNPSSGEAYTLIFRRLRDEKQSGGVPMCTSPTHSNEEEAVGSLSQESKAKEQLHSNPQVRKDLSRRHHNRKHATRWNLCCMTSVLDD